MVKRTSADFLSFSTSMRFGIVVLLGILSAGWAHAETDIGIDFLGRSGSGLGQSSMSPTESAGVVQRTNWTSMAPADGGGNANGVTTNLVDQNGNGTGAQVQWATGDGWRTDSGSDTPGNQRMMLGYIGGLQPLTINVGNGGNPLPASFGTNPYNVYVYLGSDTGNNYSDFTLTPAGGTAMTIRGAWNNPTVTSTGGFVKANGFDGPFANGNGLNGNYIVFSNVTGTSFQIDCPVKSARVGVPGIQIVQPDITNTPVTLTGFSSDVVLEDSGTPSAVQFGTGADASTWFQAQAGFHSDGLPRSGGFISETDLKTQYQLAPYTGNNCLLLTAGANGTLTLGTDAAYDKLSILAACSGGTATTTGTVVLHYSDNSTSSAIAVNTFDWGTNASNVAWSGMGRSSTSGTTFTYQRGAGFNLFETQITNPSPLKAVHSLTFTAASGIGNTGIFAVSGHIAPNFFITSVTPNSGPSGGGTSIVISGGGITGSVTVTVGGQSATVTNVDTVNQKITATVPPSSPAGALGPVNVTFTNSDNTTATLANGFTYTNGVAPTVSSVAPNAGAFNGATNVTITGSGFAPNFATNGGTIILNDGATHTVRATNVAFVSATQLTCTIPAMPAGFTSDVLNCVVTNPDGLAGTGTAVFTYISFPVITPNNFSTVGTGNGTATTQVVYYAGASQLVTLATDPKQVNASGASFYYTTDGSTPTQFAGTSYFSPFPVSGTTTVQAITVVNGISGPVQSVTYVPYLAATAAVPVSTGSLNAVYNGSGNTLPFDSNAAVTTSGIVTADSPDVLSNFTGNQAANTFAPGTTPLAPGLTGWGTLLNGRPTSTGNSDNGGGFNAAVFQARFTGILIAPTDGVYSLETGSDDGSQLFVDNVEVVANNAPQGVTRRFGQIGLKAGQHALRIDYVNTGGGFGLEALWDPAGGTNFVNIPNANLAVPIATITWTGNGTSTKWSDANNWDLLRMPTYLDNVVLTGGGFNHPTNMDIGSLTLYGLQYNASVPPLTVTDSTGTGLRFNGAPAAPIGLDPAAGDQTINAKIILFTSAAIGAGAGRILTLSGVVSGAGAVTLNANGTVLLNNTETYTGGTTISSGTLQLGDGFTNGVITGSILDNGTFTVFNAATETISGAISGSGKVIKNGPQNLFLANGNSYAGGTIVNGGLLGTGIHNSLSTPFGTGTITLAGGNLALQGGQVAGLTAQFYNNVPANTNNADPDYASLTAMNAHLNALTPAVTALTSQGGVTSLDYSNPENGHNDAPFIPNGANPGHGNYGFASTANFEVRMTGFFNALETGTYTFSTSSDDGSVLFISDTQTLPDAPTVNNNFYQGVTTRSGTVTFTSTGLKPIAIGFYQAGGGQALTVNYQAPSGASGIIPNALLFPSNPATTATTQTYPNNVVVNANASINVTISANATIGGLSIGANTLALTGDSNATLSMGSATLSGNATFDVASTNKLTLGAVTGGSNSLTKANSGTLVLSAVSTYGDTNVNAGLLQSASTTYRYFRFNPTAFRENPTNTLEQLSEMQVFNGATQLAVASATSAVQNLPNEGANNAIDGLVTTKWLDGGRNPLILDMGAPVTITRYRWATGNDSPERDPISWTFEASNDPLFSTFRVLDTRTNEPSIVTDPGRETFLPSFPAATASNILPAATHLTIAAPGTYSAGGDQTIGALAGAGNVITAGALTVGDATSTTFSGGISGAGSLVKQGVGTLTLGGATTVASTTTVNAGTLALNGTSSSAVTVNANATIRGLGTLSNKLANGTATSIIWPGQSPGGGALSANEVFTVSELPLVAANATKLKIAVSSSPQVGQQVRVTGGTQNIDLSGMTLSLGIGNGGYLGTQYTILDAHNGAANPIVAPFATPILVSGSGATVSVTYLDNNNNTIATPSTNTPANRAVLNVDGNVTPVTLLSFDARAEGAGVLLSWKLASEFENAGFNLYRRGEAGDAVSGWMRVNAALLPGRITDPGDKSYSFYDWAPAGEFRYKLETVDIHGRTVAHMGASAVSVEDMLTGGVSVESIAALTSQTKAEATNREGAALANRFGVETGAAASAQAGETIALSASKNAALVRTSEGSLAREGTVVKIASASPRAAYASASATPTGASAVSALALVPRFFQRTLGGSQTVVKVTHAGSGVLFVPRNALPAGFNLDRLRIQREGRTVSALALNAAGMYLYAPGYADAYTDKDAFFLYNSAAATPVANAATAAGLFDQAAANSAPATATAQFRDVYFDFLLRPLTYPPYFSSQYLTEGSTQQFAIDVANPTAGAATLTVNLWSFDATAGASPDHALQAFVNGAPAGQVTWKGGGQFVAATFQVPSGTLVAGTNAVTLVTPLLSGVASQTSFVHSLNVDYRETLSGTAVNQVVNSSHAAQIYEIGNLSSPNIWIVDVRYPDRAALAGSEVRQTANGYAVRFLAQPGGTGQYLAVPAGAELQPLSMATTALKPVPANVQYLATGPVQFSTPVQRLITVRSKEGLHGLYVDQQQVFDYYNYGRYGPDGIHRAVQSVRPKYLLLAGRTTYDYRDYSGAHIDPLCPTYLASTSFWAQATSDAQYGDLGRGYSEVAVGRLPVNDATEAAVAVNRILTHPGLPVSGWSAQFSADVYDPDAGDFAGNADAVISAFPSITWERNYNGVNGRNTYDCTAAMTKAASDGTNLMLFEGHGNAAALGHTAPNMLDVNSVQSWTGNVVFIAASCTFNWVAKAVPDYHSIPIQAMTQPQGGMAASIATTTYMEAAPSTEFTKQLLANAQNAGHGARWGDVLMRTQQWSIQQGSKGANGNWYMDLGNTETLLGDPAMPVYGTGTGTGAAGSIAPAGQF